jgi:NAD+ kinase
VRVLLFSQKFKEVDADLIKQLVSKLQKSSFDVFVHEYYQDENSIQLIPALKKIPIIKSKEELVSSHIDFVLTLGGDGTILKASTFVAKYQLPIIGINLGRLGFLSIVEKTKINEAIDKIKKGKYLIESRSMLKLESNKSLFKDYNYALNDFTLHKRDTSSMITINTYINDEYLNTYWADGVIVSTPTGSTGYSLACGGPIIFPGSGSFAITPIAPHNLNVRPLIIKDDVKIRFEIEGRSDHFLCTMDSRFEAITNDYKIEIKKANLTTKLMILEGHTFMSTIREKLLWGLDKRN